MNPTLRYLTLTFVATGFLSAELWADKVPPNYRKHIRTLFREKCVGCHNPNRKRGGLDLSSYAAIIEAGIAEKGEADDSLLYLVISHQEEPAMPPEGEPLSESKQAIVRDWINLGLPETSDEAQEAAKTWVPAVATPQADERVQEERRPVISAAQEGSGLAFQSHASNPVTAVAFSAEAGIVAVSNHRQAILQNVKDGSLMNVLAFPEGQLFDLAFSSDGNQLIGAGGAHAASGKVVLWDIATGERLAEYGDEFDTILATSLAPDGSSLLFGGPERILKSVDVRSGKLRYQSTKHTDWILDIAIDPEGLLFVSADRSGNVFVWELESGEPLHTLRGHRGAVHEIAWFADGNRCATAGEDGTIRVWDMHTGKQVGQWIADSKGVLGLAIVGEQLISIGRSGAVSAWDHNGKRFATHSASTTDGQPVALATDGEQIVVGGWDGKLSILPRTLEGAQNLTVPDDKTSSELAILEIEPLRSAKFFQADMQPLEQLTPAASIETHASVAVADEFARFQEQLAAEGRAYLRISDSVALLESRIQTLEADGGLPRLVADLSAYEALLGGGPEDEKTQQLRLLLGLAREKALEISRDAADARPAAGSVSSNPSSSSALELRDTCIKLATEVDSLRSGSLLANVEDSPWHQLSARISVARNRCELLQGNRVEPLEMASPEMRVLAD